MRPSSLGRYVAKSSAPSVTGTSTAPPIPVSGPGVAGTGVGREGATVSSTATSPRSMSADPPPLQAASSGTTRVTRQTYQNRRAARRSLAVSPRLTVDVITIVHQTQLTRCTLIHYSPLPRPCIPVNVQVVRSGRVVGLVDSGAYPTASEEAVAEWATPGRNRRPGMSGQARLVRPAYWPGSVMS